MRLIDCEAFMSGGVEGVQLTNLTDADVVTTLTPPTHTFCAGLSDAGADPHASLKHLGSLGSTSTGGWIGWGIVRFNNLSPSPRPEFFRLVDVLDPGKTHLSLKILSGGGVRLIDATGSTVADSSAAVFLLDTWHTIEVYFTRHDTTGRAIVRIDGGTIFDVSSQDFLATGSTTSVQLLFAGQEGLAGSPGMVYVPEYALFGDCGETDELGERFGMLGPYTALGQDRTSSDNGTDSLDGGLWSNTAARPRSTASANYASGSSGYTYLDDGAERGPSGGRFDIGTLLGGKWTYAVGGRTGKAQYGKVAAGSAPVVTEDPTALSFYPWRHVADVTDSHCPAKSESFLIGHTGGPGPYGLNLRGAWCTACHIANEVRVESMPGPQGMPADVPRTGDALQLIRRVSLVPVVQRPDRDPPTFVWESLIQHPFGRTSSGAVKQLQCQITDTGGAAPPVTAGEVTLTIEAVGDYSPTAAVVTVVINNEWAAVVFGDDAGKPATEVSRTDLVFERDVWRAFVAAAATGDGSVELRAISMVPAYPGGDIWTYCRAWLTYVEEVPPSMAPTMFGLQSPEPVLNDVAQLRTLEGAWAFDPVAGTVGACLQSPKVGKQSLAGVCLSPGGAGRGAVGAIEFRPVQQSRGWILRTTSQTACPER